MNAAGPATRPRRLLVVSDEMEVGGSQRQIVHLLTGLDRSAWQPELLYFRTPSFLVDQLEAAGVRTHCLPKRGRVDAAFLRRLHAFLAAGRYDLVHAFSLTAELWVRAMLPFLAPTRFVASVRGLCLGDPAWQWWLKRWVVRRADAIVANSRAGARMTAVRTGVPRARIDVIPNGVGMPGPLDGAARERGRVALDIAHDRICGLFVGRLVVEKNLPLLLDALARLPPGSRPLLLLAGDGPLRGPLGRQARSLRLEADLRLLGERRDAPLLMQLADFVVLPSREEGLSNVLLEAMAAGRAVIASDVGGNPELVEDGHTGLLFGSGDADALASGLRALADDPALRTRLGEAARRHVASRHAVAALVDATAALYRKVLEGPAAGRIMTTAGAHDV